MSANDENNDSKLDAQNNVSDAKTVFRKPIMSSQPDETVIKATTESRVGLSNSIEPNDDATLFRPKADSIVNDDATQFRPRDNAVVQSANHTALDAKPESADAAIKTDNSNLLKGRFVLEEVLGVGGMGIVYKAKDLLRVEAQDKDPYVAIKVLSDEFKTHPEAFISLQRESKKAQHLANQNTVKVYDFDRDGDVVFMTMEYMIGRPLDELVKQYSATGLPRNETWNILSGLCVGLIHAHAENIVHSDLKPGNVFVTDQGIAKIFDFGIARAVATIDRSQSDQDKTVFDAGDLGALTPAYASREMLLGEVPDLRDDIYALGCIAYEMLTGDHPFTRLPADEAYNKKLKPKRIQGIKNRHWKAIEAALAFKRQDRIASVEDFYKQITEKKKANVASWLLAATLLGGGAFAYTEYTKVEAPQISQEELMNQLEFKVRYQLLQENIDKLLAEATFTELWQSDIWEELQALANLFPEKPTPWYFEKRESVYQLYLSQISSAITDNKLSLASLLITNAARYSDDVSYLDAQKLSVKTLMIAQAESQKTQSKNDNLAAIKKREKANKAALAAKKKAQANSLSAAKNKEADAIYNAAMNNVEKQLSCNERLNMRNFKVAIEKLRSLNKSRYQQSEQQIISSLATCIVTTAKTHPDSARDAKRYALLLFSNHEVLASIAIKDLDGCQMSIAGLGARGTRAVCKDTLKAGGTGPTMVVVPASSKLKAFAIGKYEVTVGDYNLYCKKSKACQLTSGVSKRLPKTDISITDISNYIKWLNKQSGKKYRLPTQSEWLYATKASKNKLDPNRNCNISSRGINKGNELVKTTTGKQNSWGVVNYAGNAQELVYASGRKVMAVGGSYKTSMDECTTAKVDSHTGKADEHTGFRLARSIVGS